MSGMLVAFHTPSNEGYAMRPLEQVFYKMACRIVGGAESVHFAFTSLAKGYPDSLPPNFKNVICISKYDPEKEEAKFLSDYLLNNKIDVVFCFDLRPDNAICGLFRTCGVETIISYWGAPMSSLNTGLKLYLKKLEILLYRNKPDLFIFESEAMRDMAVNGRGIPYANTSVVPTGVNTEKFTPRKRDKEYLLEKFGIPTNDLVVVYTGHMENRKGVHVIINSSIRLIDELGIKCVSFLICGNRPGEEEPFVEMLNNTEASNKVAFAGYRNDLEYILPSCDIGVIASTGWDSFPMSSQEMAASGLPMVVSRLQGLVETVEDGVTGLLFTPGEVGELAECILTLCNDAEKRKKMAEAARKRVVNGYSDDIQVERLTSVIRPLIKGK